ncbi:Hypothetical protein NTJ_07558 [Nesidiocoris tenuis]|uniref:Uncharacterized protein n=1 Tax=Nesidiocoris tenuis TaxID=355587 RepID=A0ABN7ARB5_9HEMI|nr:Hypothetical protein NTJ_07558 [Nesidiocoris tenuis]
MYRQTGLIVGGLLLIHAVAGSSNWYRSGGGPLPLYPSSPKRQQLPYHPVARFRGADTPRHFNYYSQGYDIKPLDYLPPSYNQIPDSYVDDKMNAGELLALLFSNIKDEEAAKMRGTVRFGIVKR